MGMRWVCSVCGHVARGSAPPRTCPSCGSPFTAFGPQERDPLRKFRKVARVEERAPGHRYVIVGNSAAGRSAARAIGALDDEGAITIISEESVDFYARPMLPDFIGGMDRENVFSVARSFPAERIELVLGERVVGVDVRARIVMCAGGREVAYDSLLLATGSVPRRGTWPGSEAEGIAYFRSFADAERIATLASAGARAVVVGGGLLGLEFVRAFHARGLEIAQLVRGPQVGAPGLDEHAGAIIADALADWGVQVVAGDEVEAFESEDGRVSAVRTRGGATIACDLVGVAIGALPRLDLAESAGVECDRGILVDRRFRTSVEGIYAAGDVAQAYDRVWRAPRVNTSWRNSQDQGEAAGIFMAGGAGEHAGAVGVNFQLAAGIPFCAMGIATPEDPDEFEIEVTADRESRSYRKLVMRDGELVGAVLVGDLDQAADLEQQLRGEQAAPGVVEGGGAQGVTVGEAVEIITEERPAGQAEEATGMHKMTEDNLWAAYAGESQAHIKYLNFAEMAEAEGKHNVARLFRAASYAEQLHAGRHLEVLEGVGSTADNLAEAAAGEAFEIAEMYPAYLAVADEQEEDGAYETFEHALQAEQTHHDLYQRARQAVAAGGDANFGDLLVCSFCGYTFEGEAPEKCPVCSTRREEFVKF